MSECIAQVSGQRAGYLRTLLEAGGMPDEQAEDLVSQLFERTEEAQVSICSILSAGSGKTGRAGDVVNAECNSVASAQVGTAVYQAISPE